MSEDFDPQVAVMQQTETGEEFCAFVGTESECYEFLDEEKDQYPESTFRLEFV